MQDYRKLDVWQLSHEFAREVYLATRSFPKEERYGLTSQLRRAAVSVPTNIVEGSRRSSPAEFARFLVIAEGSAAESEYLLTLSAELIELRALGTMRATYATFDGHLRNIAKFRFLDTLPNTEACTPEESEELTRSIVETEVEELRILAEKADRIKGMLYGLRMKVER